MKQKKRFSRTLCPIVVKQNIKLYNYKIECDVSDIDKLSGEMRTICLIKRIVGQIGLFLYLSYLTHNLQPSHAA